MKKFTFLLITAFLALGLNGWTQVFITELADPNNNLNARYIELYNIGATDVNFTEGSGWLINKYTNGSATVSQSINLTGTILAGDFYIIAYDATAGTFLSVYGFEADQLDAVSNGVAGGNGDDTMELIDGAGSVADFYGVQPHADLTSTVWEFEDGRAERAFGATSGTNPPVDADWTTWSDGPGGNFQETKDAPGDFDPAEWIGASTGGNFPPTIANVVYSPFTVTSSTTVSVSADVTDSDGTIDLVELQWGTAPGVLTNYIQMSFDAGDSYISDSDIGVHPNGTIVYYQVYAEDDLGDDNSSSEMSYTVTDPATTTLPYAEPFVADLGDCYTYSVLGPSKYWNWHSDGYAQMNGYNSGATEEDWLVLPGINLDNYSNEVLSFDMWRQYGDQDADNYLKLFYSTDYPGVGDPTPFTWTELNHSQAPFEETWTSSGPVDLSAISGTMVYIAFKYNDMPTNYRWWKIDNISIIESTPVNVTFKVNMEEQIVSTDGVHMAGSFSDWWNPAAIELFDGDLDEIYEVTLALYPGFEYQFKYLNGNAWGTDEGVPLACQAPGTSNRFEVTGAADYALDVVCFGSCADCGLLFNYDITIQVDMQNEIVSGDGAYLAGSFTDWGNNAIAMTQNGTIWSTTVSLQETSFQEYKFVNGDPNNGGSWEGIGNRGFTVPGANTVLEVDCFNSYDPCPVADFVMINEVDADQDGTDAQEFIELYDGGVGNTNLSGLVVVLYNGGDDKSYLPVVDLDGESTNANGYYVLGSALVPNVDTVIGTTNIIQNGPDAVALYIGDAADFPNDTPVTDVNLIDALVYGTNDADADSLINVLTPGELQINEGGRGSSSFHSNQRIPNGSGGLRMTGTYDQSLPTPGEENVSVFNDWTGAVDSNWDDAGNWTNGVPTALLDATIPDVGANPYPVITASAFANNLYIASVATLTIAPGADLTTAGEVDNDGSFYMSSNAAGVSASFIEEGGTTGSGTFYFDRDLFCSGSNPANEADPFGWHYLSAPINGLTTDDLLDYYVNQWDEVNNEWMNFEGTEPCVPYPTEYLDDVEAWSLNFDTEYACATPGTGSVVEFSGPFWSVHSGGYSTAVTASGGSFSGWNMIGNPYPSALDPAGFDWTGFDNGTNGVAIYNGCAGNYIYSSLGNGYAYKVGPTQGFFMLSTGATTFALDGSERVHDNGVTIFKDAVDGLVTIEATGDGTSDLAYIRFMDADAGMDKADFPKLFSTTEGLAQIYTTAGQEMLAVNALPATSIVPMGFTSVTSGEYTISAIETSEFANVVLEDRFTGEQTDLLVDSYTFNYTVNDDANRFFVHFTPLGIGNNTSASINIWSNDHNIYVQTPEVDGDIVVFNMMGQEVTRTQIESGLNVIPVSDVNAFYVVKIVGSEVAKTGKVYVK